MTTSPAPNSPASVSPPSVSPAPAGPASATRASARRRARPSARPDVGSSTSAQLAVAAREGDEQAAAELYRRTVRRARAAARCFCRDADTDDAVAEGMGRAMIRLAQLHDPAAVEAWMIRCVVRSAIDLARRGQRQQPCGTVEDLSDAVAPPCESAAERALSTLERRAMAAVLGRLAEGPQLLLRLRYEAGLSVGDIAAALGRPEGTVRRQCLEARREAARCFLGQQLIPAHGPCAGITELLCRAPYARFSPLVTRRVDDHLHRCRGCRDRQQELTAVLAELGVRARPDRAPAA